MNREKKVGEFLTTMGQVVGADLKVMERVDAIDLVAFHMSIILEEMGEFCDEIEELLMDIATTEDPAEWNLAATLKELADVQYTISGFAAAASLPLEEAFRRVHTSNLTKLDDEGHPVRNSTGKVVKGLRYKSPVLDDLV